MPACLHAQSLGLDARRSTGDDLHEAARRLRQHLKGSAFLGLLELQLSAAGASNCPQQDSRVNLLSTATAGDEPAIARTAAARAGAIVAVGAALHRIRVHQRCRRQCVPSMAAHAAVRETLHPVVVDLSRGENEIKNAIREALQKTPPMFAVTGYGFENKFDHIVAAMRQRHNLHATSPEHASSRCVSFPLTDLPGGGTTEADIKSDLCALTWRICDLIMGPAFAHRLKVENQEIGGTVSMRFDPRAARSRCCHPFTICHAQVLPATLRRFHGVMQSPGRPRRRQVC